MHKYHPIVGILIIFSKVKLLTNSLSVSYNQPIFCHNASWKDQAQPLSLKPNLMSEPNGIFINSRNNIFVVDKKCKRILFMINETSELQIKTTVPTDPRNIFVTSDGTIYFDKDDKSVVSLTPNTTEAINRMTTKTHCGGLFVDLNGSIYCSEIKNNKVKKSSKDSPDAPIIVAGDGTPGKNSDQLHSPMGIFVHSNFTLYVADSKNNRVQRFLPGNLSGTTITVNQHKQLRY